MKSFKEYLMENHSPSIVQYLKRTTETELNRRYGNQFLYSINDYMKENNMSIENRDNIFLCPVENFIRTWNRMNKIGVPTAYWYENGKFNVIEGIEAPKIKVILDYKKGKSNPPKLIKIDEIQPTDNGIVIVEYYEENMHYV